MYVAFAEAGINDAAELIHRALSLYNEGNDLLAKALEQIG